MEAEENDLLVGRIESQVQARQYMVVFGALVSLLLVALLTATYVLIRRQLQDKEASQRALAESEISFSITLNSIGDAVLATDAEGRITRMNPVAERLTGWPFAQAQGRPVNEVFRIVHEETRVPAEVPVAKVLSTGEIQGLANHSLLIARNGIESPIADSAAPICDDAGRVSGVVLVFRDVTFERQVEWMIRKRNELLEQRVRERTEQLHVSEDHLRSVISNVPAMIAYVDARQRYVYVNDEYREHFVPGVADITGCTVREILGDEFYAIAAPFIVKALQGESQSYDQQLSLGVWRAINYMPKHDAQGRVVGYYVLGMEITERKQAEKKLDGISSNPTCSPISRDADVISASLNLVAHVNLPLRTKTLPQFLNAIRWQCRNLPLTQQPQLRRLFQLLQRRHRSTRRVIPDIGAQSLQNDGAYGCAA